MPFLISRLGNPEGKRGLDLACGIGRHSGALALEAAEVVDARKRLAGRIEEQLNRKALN